MSDKQANSTNARCNVRQCRFSNRRTIRCRRATSLTTYYNHKTNTPQRVHTTIHTSSSMMSNERDVAWLNIVEVSCISTANVDRPAAKQSDAPIRANNYSKHNNEKKKKTHNNNILNVLRRMVANSSTKLVRMNRFVRAKPTQQRCAHNSIYHPYLDQ